MARMLFISLLLLLPWTTVSADDFAKEKKHFDTEAKRPPLSKRRAAFFRMARTKDARALPMLMAKYAKPRQPKEHEQYQVANAIGRHLGQDRAVKTLIKFAKRYRKTTHAWLWRQCYRAVAEAGAVPALRAVIESPKEDIVRRAIAMEALSNRFATLALDHVAPLLSEWPKSDADGVALASVAAAVFDAAYDHADEAKIRLTAEALVALFKNDDVPDPAKLTVARYLARAYGTRVTTDHAFWIRIIRHEPTDPDEHTTVARPKFFGLEATGRRVAYLLDLSDSMLAPLTDREVLDARTDAQADPDHPINWKRIKTRFDLARAYLIQALRSLDAQASFVIIGFGKEAEVFKTTRGLVRASRGAVEAAIGELRRIRAKRSTRKREHGRLKGSTNLHGAILRGFRAVSGKVLDEFEHTDPRTLTKGCDTLYVLSDGKPTDDDFDAPDTASAGTVVVDRETGETAQAGGGRRLFYGPYQFNDALLEDIERLNLLRKVEMHTIAIGEADTNLLLGMSKHGLGNYRSVGVLGRSGLLNAWWLIGPFAAPDEKDWTREEGPEQGVDLAATIQRTVGRARWKRTVTSHPHGVVSLKKSLAGENFQSAYAYARIAVELPGKHKLWLGSDDGIRIWVNGALVHESLTKRTYKKDQDSVDITLKEGANEVLVKSVHGAGGWRFALRLANERGPVSPRIR